MLSTMCPSPASTSSVVSVPEAPERSEVPLDHAERRSPRRKIRDWWKRATKVERATAEVLTHDEPKPERRDQRHMPLTMLGRGRP